jgi:hypothetical protein
LNEENCKISFVERIDELLGKGLGAKLTHNQLVA